MFLQQSISSKIFIFLFSLILGLVLVIIYDVFRIVRMIINSKNVAVFIQDVLYFIISGIITFIFVLGVNSGDSRFYILAGEGIGWIIYHITLGEIIYKYSSKIVSSIKSKIRALREKFFLKFSKKHGKNK